MHRVRKSTMLALAGAGVLATALFAQSPQANQPRSLGDVARELREKKALDVQITATDAKELFTAMDEILKFASKDSGYARRTTVKRELVGHERVERQFTEEQDKQERERLIRSEVVLKKFGLLPPTYDLQKNLVKEYVKDLAGFYSSKTKTMYLVNWVPLHEQKPVMAHELTHALQDQNYDLLRFMKAGTAGKGDVPKLTAPTGDESERSTVRRAMVEGQAMVVYMDYLGKPLGLTLANSREGMAVVLAGLRSYDAPVTVNNNPKVLEETQFFPYREGFAFEVEVLEKRGREEAFGGVFARPPQSTHEVLHPAAYMNRAKTPEVTIPDLTTVLGSAYQAYDAGLMGELDARIMALEFGRENDLFSVAEKWDGGAYAVVKRTSTEKAGPVTTADLAAIYVSRWKSFEAAKRFAQIYQRSLSKRVRVLKEENPASACTEVENCKSPLWSARIMTEEGPTFMEIWPDNTMLITHSFDEATTARLRQAVLFPKRPARRSGAPKRELSMSLYESATFAAVQEKLGREIMKRLDAQR